MSFILQVSFSGLCLYVTDAANGRVGILMPDCRLKTAIDEHEDGTIGQPHVGYLRFDLANLDSRFRDPGGEDTENEGVHQFDMEDLEFVVTGAAAAIPLDKIGVPEFEKIAPDPAAAGKSIAVPIDDLFKPQPPKTLLMRTLLSDGDLAGLVSESWLFPNLLNPGKPPYEKPFAPVVKWTRRVDSVTLRLKKFDGTRTIEFSLAPPKDSGENAVVHVKVANLCATNPLEWDNLGFRAVDEDDEDFKWLYRLVKPGSDTWKKVLQRHRFPIPMVPPDRATGVEDCLGAQVGGSTT